MKIYGILLPTIPSTLHSSAISCRKLFNQNIVFRFYYYKTIHKYEAYKSFDFNIILFQDVDSPLSKFG